MTTTISDEQRSELFSVVSNLENPIGEIGSLVLVLDRIARCVADETDMDALFVVSCEIKRRADQISEANSKLYSGLHVDPRASEEIKADVELAKNARAS